MSRRVLLPVLLISLLIAGCAVRTKEPVVHPEPAAVEPLEGTACESHDECGEGRFCAKRQGDCDGDGTCADRPEICAQYYKPVCGCDGRDYSNACTASAAGVNVDREGRCDGEEVR